MDVPRRRKGRPRKEKDRIEHWQFGRAAKVMYAYDEARKRGEKHSVAVREAVNFVKLHDPEIPVSQTEVKRILAKWRPRGSQTILCFERKILSEEDLKRYQLMWDQVPELQWKFAPQAHSAVFTIRFGERPNYPRHNRKKHKDNPSS